MKKLHLATIANKSEGLSSVFIYTEKHFLKQINTASQTTILLHDDTEELTFMYGDAKQTLSLAELIPTEKQRILLTDNMVIQICLLPKIRFLDRINLMLGLCSGVLAIGYSFFVTSNWRELLFLLGSTIIVLLLFMILYKHPIESKHYNLRMLSTISALILIFLLIPFENWTLKTLLGLSTLTVITRFIKHYNRTLTKLYNPFIKP
ncbi:hypothetical protein ACPDHL_03895 [Myroides sp. C15-4]|uniref:hypothetical protein n=1 Tax=Myroides sp. C15-4 TaxID=3400532 RepID=UPI003D2F9B32